MSGTRLTNVRGGLRRMSEDAVYRGSTLLLLVESFLGPRWRDLYATALAEGYRFLSFGDCMVLGRGGAGVSVAA